MTIGTRDRAPARPSALAGRRAAAVVDRRDVRAGRSHRSVDDVVATGRRAARLARRWSGSSSSGSCRSSGVLGFVVCWFVAFLALYAGGHRAVGNPRVVVVDRVAVGGDPRRPPLVVGVALCRARRLHRSCKGWARAAPPRTSSPRTCPGSGRATPLDQGGVLHAIVGIADRGRHRGRDRAAARRRHRGLHDRGRRPARRRRAHRRRGDDGAARRSSPACSSTRSSSSRCGCARTGLRRRRWRSP